MGITTTAQISATINWSQVQTQANLTNFSDIGSVQFDRDLFTGSGSNQVNHLWHDVKTLASGGTNSIDLFSLDRTILNDTINMSFSGGNVKAVALANLSSLSGADINVVATGVDGLTIFFPNGIGHKVYPSSSALIVNRPIEGFNLGTQHWLHIKDVGGSGAKYSITIIGTSG